ncbi:phage holin family protein [Sphingomonas sp. M1-B02]|uniref:phage holin family protein n=1 Tax=Sphingomonas sp. M1-B02 TaxID=3114300 RepID=UPI002240C8EA|nr:phage holin family protein [Sphingomonas sp. S6-11]UZK66826.1 phage holin family protein [Sphingomonas sp. S6-11]
MAEPQLPDEGLGDLLGRLVDEGKGYARAEVGYYRTLVRSKLRDARAMLWMGAAALTLAQAAMIALVVGLVLTLSPYVGPGWATLIVVVAILLVAGIMARLAWVHVKRIIGEKP